VLFDKIASVYFIRKIYFYFSIGNGQPREPALRQLYRHTVVPYTDDLSVEARLAPRAKFDLGFDLESIFRHGLGFGLGVGLTIVFCYSWAEIAVQNKCCLF